VKNLSLSIFSLFVGIVVSAAVVLLNGHNPLTLFGAALSQAVMTRTGLLQILAGMVPLTLVALTFAVSFRAGLFNVGAEGAMLIGAAASIAVGGLVSLPPGIHLVLTILAAAAAGFLWSVPAAYLKSKRHVHEVVTTIMANYLALYLVSFLVAGPLRDYGAAFGTFAVEIRPSARFAIISGPLTWAIVLAFLIPILAFVFIWHTRQGTHMRATGHNPGAAHHAGINTSRMMMLAFGVGGATAGLAGCILTAGLPPDWTTNDELSALVGFGHLGIAVAMIGRNHPFGCIAAALLVSIIRTSRFALQQMGVSPEITDILIGVVILAFALPELYRFSVALLQFASVQRTKALAPA
jgi:ABC-type uncharacterized transport system permease subunit